MPLNSWYEGARQVARISIPIGAFVAAAALALSPAHAVTSEGSAQAEGSPTAVESSPPDETLALARSEAATRVLDWVAASRDNGELPYIVIDKNAGMLFLFDGEGEPLGEAPVLIGVATGDDASPGIGSKKLSGCCQGKCTG